MPSIAFAQLRSGFATFASPAIYPIPFLLSREQKMHGFSQNLKSIKWQDLLEEGKNGRNAFRTGAKSHFSEKIFQG